MACVADQLGNPIVLAAAPSGTAHRQSAKANAERSRNVMTNNPFPWVV